MIAQRCKEMRDPFRSPKKGLNCIRIQAGGMISEVILTALFKFVMTY